MGKGQKTIRIAGRHAYLVALLLIAIVFGPSSFGLDEYRAKELDSKRLQIQTPYGEKTYFGEFGIRSLKNYKVTIPLSDLRPAVPTDPKDPDKKDSPEASSADRKVNSDEKIDSKVTTQILQMPGQPTPTPTPTPSPTAEEDDDEEQAKEQAVKESYNFDDTDRMVVEANRLFNQKKYYDALLYVDELIRKRPTYLRAWVMKGSLLYSMGHKDLAKDAWDQALKLEPNNGFVKDLLVRYR